MGKRSAETVQMLGDIRELMAAPDESQFRLQLSLLLSGIARRLEELEAER